MTNNMDNKTKRSVLFVCHGNICRSPMAEFILRRLAKEAGIADEVEVASAATSNEEIGNPVYPLAKRTLAIHGIGCGSKSAQRITQSLYDWADYVVVMDGRNLSAVSLAVNVRSGDKLCRLLDFLPADDPKHGMDIADPWYTRDFETAYSDIHLGCKALMARLVAELA